ncbi:MAG TPA: NAD(P)-binding domain-containing protein [Methanospirillum sp.]|uniref:ornithine cyclodeaminase family protein n=1 Tax=Methanospirillum sp. TaxID=45200 RepID=UPI002BE33D15|nr:ornithine cyclodeaminase family protein [Methanospirillum sp.]HOJ95258.1 NAD(P)-binding domain-containing protein [Methanospirillum sp.]
MQYYPAPEEVVEMDSLISAVESAFIDHGAGRSVMPPKVYVSLPGGDFRTMPSYIPSLHTAGVKIVNVHPDNRKAGLPTVMAVTILLDPPTGEPVAVLNATTLTDLRTGASAAVATKALAQRKSGTIGIIGSGKQADSGLMAISRVFQPEEVLVWSRTRSHAEMFAERYADLPVKVTDIETAAGADVLLTVTPSRAPLIREAWISDGAHINAMGADAPGKQELDPDILLRAYVCVDDMEQAIHSGEVNVPIREGIFRPDQIAGTLGRVLTGAVQKPSPGALTIFDSTGLSITDLAAAHLAIGKGRAIDLPFLHHASNSGIAGVRE